MAAPSTGSSSYCSADESPVTAISTSAVRLVDARASIAHSSAPRYAVTSRPTSASFISRPP